MADCNYLKELIEEGAKFIPHQPPLQFFVHHNTLQNFEDLHFKEGIYQASERFSAQSFMSEEQFNQAIIDKRITVGDIEAVILEQCPDCRQQISKSLPTRFDFRKQRLLNLFTIPTNKSINWHLENKLTGKEEIALFKSLKVPDSVKIAKPKKAIRPRDKILAKYDIDTDELVNPLLIKLSAAYLDQGLAFNSMPDRSKGFLHVFRKLYSSSKIGSQIWARELQKQCQNQEKFKQNTLQTILAMMQLMKINKADESEFIIQSLLSLKGWAGMFYQYQHSPEKMPVAKLPATLSDFLAVRLTLDMIAANFVLKQQQDSFKNISSIENNPDHHLKTARQILQYEAFIAAKNFNLSAKDFLSVINVKKWYKEITC